MVRMQFTQGVWIAIVTVFTILVKASSETQSTSEPCYPNEKYLGQFDVEIENLIPHPTIGRQLYEPHVDNIERTMDGFVSLIFPVCHTVNQSDNSDQIKKFYFLGGQHLLYAIKRKDIIKKVHVNCFTCLSDDEAYLVYASNQRAQANVKVLTFCDKVKIARSLDAVDGEDLTYKSLQKKLYGVTGKKVKRQSLSTVMSVARYPRCAFEKFLGLEGKVPLKFWKILQGKSDDEREKAITNALQNPKEAMESLAQADREEDDNLENEATEEEEVTEPLATDAATASESQQSEHTQGSETMELCGMDMTDTEIIVRHKGRDISMLPAVQQLVSLVREDICRVAEEHEDLSLVPTEDLFNDIDD